MGKQVMFVGGEFYDDPVWLVDTPTLSTRGMTFLNGGKACLIVISEVLLSRDIQHILLPAYLCPTIVNTLEHSGLTCEYYQIKPDFSIDLDDLAQKVDSRQAVYFINYFGFLQPASVRDYLYSLRQKGILVVEDNAQVGFSSQTIGDFVFNSIRKLAAYDGGYLIAPVDVKPILHKHQGTPNRRLPVIREYRRRLVDYLFQGEEIFDDLSSLYELAEAIYETDDVVEGDPQEQWGSEHLDWQRIKQVRRENYAYLSGLISAIPELSPVFPVLQADNMPLGFPVYVNGVPRDWLFDALGNAGIGLTIHWDGLLTDPRLNGNPAAVDMASRILTLVIDQRTSRTQLDYMVETICECIRDAKRRVN
jgi:hypothetical protein